MKKLFALFLISTILGSSALALETFSDSFINNEFISSTNLKHVTDDGYLTIDNEGYYSNTIAVNDYASEETTEYAVINNGKIEIYTLNEDNSTTIREIKDKEGKISSPIGITYANNGHSIWVLNEDSLVKYDLNDSENVVTKISGLSNVMGITSSKGYETVSILDSEGNVTGYKELIENELMTSVGALSITSSNAIISNPLAISSVGGTDNIVTMNNGQIAIYEYDDDSGLQGTALTGVSMGNAPFAISANEKGFVLSNSSGVSYYTIEGVKDNARNVIYANENIDSNVVGISLKQDEFEYAIIDEDGKVRYYQYDGKEMVENQELSAEGIEVPRRLKLPGKYRSTEILSENSEMYDKITLYVNQSIPSGFDIEWWVDTDSGEVSFGSNGGTRELEQGSSNFRIIAELTNDDYMAKYGDLPEIYEVELVLDNKEEEAAIDTVEIIGITKNIAGQELPKEPPVDAKRGSEVVVKVTTVGNIEDVEMILRTSKKELKSVYMEEIEDTGIFIGSIVFEPDDLEGESIEATFIPDKGPMKTYPVFINIESAVSYDLDLRIRQ